MLNRIILMGRIVNDLELRQTPNGIHVVSFSIAVERNYSSGGQRITDFINVVAWRQTAEFICNYFAKGRMIAVEGSLQSRNYEDKQGNKRTAFEVLIDQAYFADSKPSGNSTGQNTFQVPAQKAADTPANVTEASFESSDFSDFEELESDEADLPF